MNEFEQECLQRLKYLEYHQGRLEADLLIHQRAIMLIDKWIGIGTDAEKLERILGILDVLLGRKEGVKDVERPEALNYLLQTRNVRRSDRTGADS